MPSLGQQFFISGHLNVPQILPSDPYWLCLSPDLWALLHAHVGVAACACAVTDIPKLLPQRNSSDTLLAMRTSSGSLGVTLHPGEASGPTWLGAGRRGGLGRSPHSPVWLELGELYFICI